MLLMPSYLARRGWRGGGRVLLCHSSAILVAIGVVVIWISSLLLLLSGGAIHLLLSPPTAAAEALFRFRLDAAFSSSPAPRWHNDRASFGSRTTCRRRCGGRGPMPEYYTVPAALAARCQFHSDDGDTEERT